VTSTTVRMILTTITSVRVILQALLHFNPSQNSLLKTLHSGLVQLIGRLLTSRARLFFARAISAFSRSGSCFIELVLATDDTKHNNIIG